MGNSTVSPKIKTILGDDETGDWLNVSTVSVSATRRMWGVANGCVTVGYWECDVAAVDSHVLMFGCTCCTTIAAGAAKEVTSGVHFGT